MGICSIVVVTMFAQIHLYLAQQEYGNTVHHYLNFLLNRSHGVNSILFIHPIRLIHPTKRFFTSVMMIQFVANQSLIFVLPNLVNHPELFPVDLWTLIIITKPVGSLILRIYRQKCANDVH
jgi:hypothetical protein